MTGEDTTVIVQAGLDLGTEEAWTELLGLARERFYRLARLLKGKKTLPDATDDLVQKASLRLFRTPPEVRPRTAREYFGFVTLQIRRELIDVVRQAQRRPGPLGQPASDTPGPPELSDDTQDPAKLALWQEFHEKVGNLPDDEREVFELWWYGERSQPEIAELLSTSLATVKRRLLGARRQLHSLVGGQLPF